MAISAGASDARLGPFAIMKPKDFSLRWLLPPGDERFMAKRLFRLSVPFKCLKRIGHSIKEIRGILSLTRSENTRDKKLTRKLRKTLSSSLSQIRDEIELLSAARDKITDLLEKTKNCEGCGAQDCASCGKLRDLRTMGLLS